MQPLIFSTRSDFVLEWLPAPTASVTSQTSAGMFLSFSYTAR
jgi:hypothetical protein